MFKVCVVTGTRADYGLLRELLFRLKNNPEIELDLVVTGSHLSPLFGNTQEEIIQDGFTSFSRVFFPIEDDSKGGMAYATGSALCSFAQHFKEHPADLLVVLGDRYEILAAAIAARMCGIPIAHISGGDVTEGAVDDSIRHAVTKMSSLHFPGCEQSRQRVIQMGEQPDSVFNVGEPGVENCLKAKLLSRAELAQSVSFQALCGDYAVVTFHPVTTEADSAVHQVRELARAMDAFPQTGFLITKANADAGGRAINQFWDDYSKKRQNWLVTPSLGVKRYLSALKYAKAVVGNSSSGIIEAPSMGIPTVNIGDRQKGRMLAQSVLCCRPEATEIKAAMTRAFSEPFQERSKTVVSPFGDGSTSKLMEEHILAFLRCGDKTGKKRFFDIAFHGQCNGRVE